MPRLSIIIPAHNEEHYIGQCLDSVRRDLHAAGQDAEIIVVNNASTDRTAAVAATFAGVTVVTEPKKGLARARQAGYAHSTGDLIANIDADTMLPSGWVKKVLEAFAEDPKLVALSGPFIYYDLPARTRAMVRLFYAGGYASHVINHYVLHVGAMLQGGNFIVRRTALEEIGGYDTSIVFYGEDTDVARRLAKVGRVRWTFDLPIYASGRRLAHEGILKAGGKYALNFVSTTWFRRPVTKEHTDVRAE